MTKKQTAKDRYLRKKYGITLAVYNEMLKDQHDSCALCGKHKSNFKKSLHVDHNHKTGQVRGLCCYYCNKRRIGRNDTLSVAKLQWYMLKYERGGK